MGMGGGSSAPSTTTVQQQTVPPFLENAYLEGIDRARAASTAPYQAYQGQRLEGFTPAQEQSQQMVQQGIGQFMPTYNAGVAATQAGSTPFQSSDIDAYMNPYRQNVTDEIGRLGNQNFNENLMPSINSQFTGGGMFGSSRNAVALGRAAENTQRDITGQQGNYLSQGYQQSMQNLQADRMRQLQAGSQLTSQAAQGQQMYGNDVNALAGVGQQQQQMGQQGLDVGYNQFLEQQQYPEAQAQWFNNIVRGIPQAGLVTQQTQNYGQAGNPISQALGLAGTLYGATNGTANHAKGGSVKAKKMKVRRSTGMGNYSYA